MPPKIKAKTIEKQKDKVIKDATFGLKNKNKSKTVQKEIKGFEMNMKGMTKEQKKEQEEKEKRKLEKLAEKQREKELQALFRKLDDGKGEGEETKPETVEELDDQIEEEMKDEAEMTLEEIVEKERAKIIEGTKITFETFQKWKAFKKEQKEKEEERKRKLQELNYKKSGTGLSGKALFEINANIFIDDDDAADVDEYKVEEENQIDDSLFLEGEIDDNVNDKTFSEKKSEPELVVEEYTPETWKDKKTPKALLLEYLQSKGVGEKDTPIFAGGEKESICMVTLPHIGVDLKNKKSYKLKKIAEHNAALLALAWLKKEEEKKK